MNYLKDHGLTFKSKVCKLWVFINDPVAKRGGGSFFNTIHKKEKSIGLS